MPVLTVDAVVVGGGHHGLVAAALLADAGWDVCLLEASDRVGGAVRSEALHPGFTADLFSAFYPLYAASPVLQALDLEAHGLRLSHAPVVLAHPPCSGANVVRPLKRTTFGLALAQAANSDHASKNASSFRGSTSNLPYVKISGIAPPRV